MNWKYYDSIILKKLKPKSKKTQSPSMEGPKPQLEGLDSLLSNPVLVNLDDLFVTQQDDDSEKLQRLSYTCFVCDGNFPSVTDKKRHSCHNDATMTSSSVSDESSAYNDALSESTMTSELTRSSSEDSGFSSLGDDSICGSLPRAKSCQFFTESPNKSKKRRWSSSEYKYEFMPEQKRIRVQNLI